MKEKKQKKELTVSEVFGSNAQQQSEAVVKSKLIGRVIIFAACFLILVMAVLYVLSFIKAGYGSFTIRVGDVENATIERQLSLSETKGFSNPTTNLKAESVDDMNNITYSWLDVDEICSVDGNNNADNYLAYSFYIKNTGTQSFYYSSCMNNLGTTKGIESAIRVLIRKNDTDTIYAKESKSGGTEVYPEGLTNFYSEDQIFNIQDNYIEPGQSDRYTVLIWLEGEDPECVNDIMQGTIKIEIAFDIVD